MTRTITFNVMPPGIYTRGSSGLVSFILRELHLKHDNYLFHLSAMITAILRPLVFCFEWLSNMVNRCMLHTLLPPMKRIRNSEKSKVSKTFALHGIPKVFFIRFVAGQIYENAMEEVILKAIITTAKCCPNQGWHPMNLLGMKEKILVFKAEIAGAVFSSKPCYVRRPSEYRMFGEVLDGLTSIDDPEKWKLRRRLGVSWFHKRNIDGFIPLMNKYSQLFVQRLHQRTGDPVNIYSYVQDFALDVAFEIVLGREFSFQKPSALSEKVKEELNVVFVLTSMKLLNPLWYNDRIFSLSSSGRKYFRSLGYLRNFLRKVIREKLQNTTVKNSRADDNGTIISEDSGTVLLDYRIKGKNVAELGSQNGLLQAILLQVILSLIFGAEDTAHQSVSMALLLIGQHPEVQSKIQKELDEVFMGDRLRPITKDDIEKLEYLQCVIKETLRLYPPVPSIGLTISSPDPFSIGDHEFKSGTDFFISIWLIHRDPKYFPSPERFIPERFMPNSPYNFPRHPYAFIPFSGGPRNCMGFNMAYNVISVVLADILRNFSIQSLVKRDQLRFAFGAIAIPIVPLRAYFSPRQVSSSDSHK